MIAAQLAALDITDLRRRAQSAKERFKASDHACVENLKGHWHHDRREDCPIAAKHERLWNEYLAEIARREGGGKP